MTHAWQDRTGKTNCSVLSSSLSSAKVKILLKCTGKWETALKWLLEFILGQWTWYRMMEIALWCKEILSAGKQTHPSHKYFHIYALKANTIQNTGISAAVTAVIIHCHFLVSHPISYHTLLVFCFTTRNIQWFLGEQEAFLVMLSGFGCDQVKCDVWALWVLSAHTNRY